MGFSGAVHHVCTRLRSGTTPFLCLFSILGNCMVWYSLMHSSGQTFGLIWNLRKRLYGGEAELLRPSPRRRRRRREKWSLLDGLKQSLEIRTAWIDAWPQLTADESLHFLCFCFPICEIWPSLSQGKACRGSVLSSPYRTISLHTGSSHGFLEEFLIRRGIAPSI